MSIISPIFLFFFLPVITFTFYLLSNEERPLFLLGSSLFLYFFANPISFPILILVCIIASASMVLPSWFKATGNTALVVLCLLLVLLVFKYSNFILENFNFLSLELVGRPILNQSYFANIWLPIGISFYIFQAISFVLDSNNPNKNFNNLKISEVFLYISFFPQLIAGPIVRFSHFYKELKRLKRIRFRKNDVSIGIKLLLIGLSKKIFIADYFGGYVDIIFSMSPSELSWELALLGPILFLFQIYFDFSGYSDMAVGLGRIFNIRLLKNFKLPYKSLSITEFWRRWHISLSSWFKDYLYIPLGGNRVKKVRVLINLIIVFVLCGFWHGASWIFIIWGVWHGLFLVFEKILFSLNLKIRIPKIIKWLYMISVVLIGWAIFRSVDLLQLESLFKAVFTLQEGIESEKRLLLNFDTKLALFILMATFISLGGWNKMLCSIRSFSREQNITYWPLFSIFANSVSNLSIIVFGFLALATVMSGTFSSFIYFQF